jgi:uncharacterized protein (TIGR00251 family)
MRGKSPKTTPETPANTNWTLAIRAIPNASRSEIVGWEQEILRVKLKAVPEDGRANQELIRLLSERSGLPRKSFQISAGEHSRNKVLKVSAMTPESFKNCILPST